ncbi:MAG TPA: stage II sporulation protein R [Limnochordia bacterium]
MRSDRDQANRSQRHRRCRCSTQAAAVALLCTLLVGTLPAQALGRPIVDSELASQVLRLHFVANSDRPADQALKRRVKDAVLQAFAPVFLSAGSRDEAEAAVRAHWHEIEAVALSAVRQAGYRYGVRLEFGPRVYPEVTSGPIHLPAGEYLALRIVIGAGQGHNFWCVLFPPLCFGSPQGGIRLTVGEEELDPTRAGAERAGVVEAAPASPPEGRRTSERRTPTGRARIEWRIWILEQWQARHDGEKAAPAEATEPARDEGDQR